jgi:hypothetical protein
MNLHFKVRKNNVEKNSPDNIRNNASNNLIFYNCILLCAYSEFHQFRRLLAPALFLRLLVLLLEQAVVRL